MGFVKVKGHIGATRERLEEVEFLVDTGAFYTVLSPLLAAALGIAAPVPMEVVVADSRKAEMRLGAAYLRLGDREGGIAVGVMEVPMPLLGASALEALGLKVNPVDGILEPTRPFGPAAL